MTGWPHYINTFDVSAFPSLLRRKWTGPGGDVPELCAELHKNDLIPVIGSDLRRIPPILLSHHRQPRISEISDPALNPSAGDHDTIVIVLERRGVDVGCAAIRLKWIERTLKEAIESQTLMFDDPKLISAPPSGQQWVCDALPAQYDIRSQHIVISNALCLHDERPGEKFPDEVIGALMRLLHLRAYVQWRWSYLTAYGRDGIARKHAIDTDGFSGFTSGIARIEGSIATNYRFMWTDRMSFGRIVRHASFGDLSRPLGMIGQAPPPVAEKKTGQVFGGCTI